MNLFPENGHPPPDRGTVVVWGFLASMPFGGMVWQVMHHLAGFRALGFDVWYVEDSHNPCMHPNTWQPVDDYSDTRDFVHHMMSSIGLGDRWVFRPPRHDECLGALDSDGLKKLYRESEAVFNLCGSHRVRPDHDQIKCLVLIETDPVAPQINVASGHEGAIRHLANHHYIFTYAENIGREDCKLPVERFNWIPTRPPVVTRWWATDFDPGDGARLTTVANWSNTGKDLEWRGETYTWQKCTEFEKVIGLPSKSPLQLELALVGLSEDDYYRMTEHGWFIIPGRKLSDYRSYRRYIRTSIGEFTVAKDQNVRFRSGWFSDRSACYLAAGRPVVTQDTAFQNSVPAGKGLFSFSSEDEAASAIRQIAKDRKGQSAAAYELARSHFEAEKLLGEMADRIGI